MKAAAPHRSVHRYFEPYDLFVRIRLCDAREEPPQVASGMGRDEYREAVFRICLPDRAQNAIDSGDTAAREQLYDLIVEVNPSFDIRKIELHDETPFEEEPALAVEEEVEELFFERLRTRVHDLEARLAERVIGQPEAIAATTRCLQRAAAGLAPEARPLASLFFVGRTGTGKTELARAISEAIFCEPGWESESALVRIDCSEYAHAHEYSKLIGSPPGYVGHAEGGQLTEAVKKNAECVVLFDEIEKADARLHNLLLQILEEGALTDGRGERVSFERAVVVMTSNAGAPEIAAASKTVGFGSPRPLDGDGLQEITVSALEEHFRPEFLGRIDETILFRHLELESARRIAQTQLTELAIRVRRRGLSIAFTPAVAQWVAERGFSPEHGARELRRVVQREIEPQLATRLLALSPGERENGLLRVRVRRDQLQFELED